jgi:Protein of unknown function (DUF742)
VSTDQFDESRPTSGALVRPFLAAGVTAEGVRTPEPLGQALRPFLLTSGRVAAETSVAIETQVVATELGGTSATALTFERRDIVTLCAEPVSIAEIAARLRLHVGVVKVLVGDLSAEGYLVAYLPNADAPQDVDTLLRVIRGLRAIS